MDQLTRRTLLELERHEKLVSADQGSSNDENNTAAAARESSGRQTSDEMTGQAAPTQRGAVSAQVLYAQTPLLRFALPWIS